MVVDVRDEDDRGRPGLLRIERLAQIARVLGGDDPVEDAVRVALTGLVVEDEDEPALERVVAQVVMRQLRRSNPEAGEDHFALDAPARREVERREALPHLDRRPGPVLPQDLELVVVTELGPHERERVAEGVLATHRLETEPLEPRLKEAGRERVLGGVGQTPAHLVRGEKEEIRPELVREDRVLARRRLRRERKRDR